MTTPFTKTFTHVPGYFLPDLSVIESEQFGRRYVTPEGNAYPSVTTVLKDPNDATLRKWKERVGEEEAARISKAATERGNSVHLLCETYLLNKPIDWSSELKAMKARWSLLRPILNKIDNIVFIEQALWSDRRKIAGRVDCIADYNGVRSIIDFKTSTKVKKKEYIQGYFMQATAYSLMFEERFGERIDNIAIIISGDEINQVFEEQRSKFIQPLDNRIGDYWKRQEKQLSKEDQPTLFGL